MGDFFYAVQNPDLFNEDSPELTFWTINPSTVFVGPDLVHTFRSNYLMLHTDKLGNHITMLATGKDGGLLDQATSSCPGDNTVDMVTFWSRMGYHIGRRAE